MKKMKQPQDIKDLEQRIDDFQRRKQNERKAPKSSARIMIEGAMRMATEFVAPVIIALCIGYVLDKALLTKPIMMLIMVMFGCAAGVLNVYKAAKQIDADMNKE